MRVAEKLKESALVLFSGGLDSSVALAIACQRYTNVTALTFDYRQDDREEIRSAIKICEHLGMADDRHLIMQLSPMRAGACGTIRGRNTIFLSYALRACLVMRYGVVVVADSADNDSRDSSTAYVKVARELLDFFGVQLFAPILGASKSELILLLADHRIPGDLVHACRGRCWHCRKCVMTRINRREKVLKMGARCKK